MGLTGGAAGVLAQVEVVKAAEAAADGAACDGAPVGLLVLVLLATRAQARRCERSAAIDEHVPPSSIMVFYFLERNCVTN